MKKIFTKIAGAALGLAMAIGVGVGIAASQKGAVPAEAAVNDVVTISSVDYKSIYFTGFESCNTDTNYQSTKTYTSSNANGASWSVYYGTVSTDSKITGTRSCQLRLYSNQNAGYAMTTSDIAGVRAFRFNYTTSNSNVAFKVQISTNEGSTWTDQTITTDNGVATGVLTSTAAKFRIKVLVTGGFPSSSNRRLTLDDFEFFSPVVAVTGVEIDGDTHEVAVGEDLNLSAIITPPNATNKNVTWSIDNLSPAGCATINATTGVLHGVAAGSGKVTVTTADGPFTDTEDFTVTSFVAVESVSLNKASTTLYVGETETLEETVLPNDASNKNVSWTSDAEGVATVEGGVITAIAAGTAHITATSVSDGTKSASCTVTVNNRAVTGISLNKSETSIVKGGTETLVATVEPSNATFKTVTWESSATAVATVSNGVVSAVAQGETVISAKANGFINEQATPDLIAKCTVTVTDVVTVGKKYILAAVYTDSNSVLHQEYLSGVFYADNGKSGYGQRTSFTVAPAISYPIEIVNGSTSNTYGLKLSDGKYLGYYADGTISANHLRALDDLDSKTSWTITASGDNFNIAPSDAESRTIRYNGTSGQERFAAYTSGQNPVRLIEIDDTAYAGHFVETYMHVDVSTSTKGDGSCKTSGWYAQAKAAFFDKTSPSDTGFHLTPTQRLAVKNSYPDYYLRLQYWAEGNNESIDINELKTDIVLNAKADVILINQPENFDNNTLLIIVICSITTVAIFGGYFFLRKRKEQ